MFGKDKKEEDKFLNNPEGNETVIGPTVKVDGDFVGNGNVLVQGIVNGSLLTKGDLRVEKQAKIKANIEASNAYIEGEVKGNVMVAGRLELGAASSVEGDVSAEVLSIEPGALLNGHCSMSAQEAKGRESEPATVQKPAVGKKSS